MEKLDDFTLNLLGNDEVLAVDQDPLGRQATCVLTNGDVRIYLKPLADGGHAVGFFNLDSKSVNLDFNQFDKIGLTGELHVRDLWREQDVANVDAVSDVLPMTLPAHGVMLYKVTAGK